VQHATKHKPSQLSRNMKIIVSLFLISLFSFNLVAQDLDSNIVKTIEGTINETYKIISGERGEKRNWEAFRQLFTPQAQMSVLLHDSTGNGILRTYTLEQFVRIGKEYYENDGFIERPIRTVIHEYNGIANVFQSYYAKELDVEEEGVNSLQLMFDGKRWWITSVLWTNNGNGVQLPDEFKE
jgi:hypothetical protein